MTTVALTAGDSSYEIHIGAGILAQAGSLIRSATAASRFAIISDTRVAPLYGARVEQACAAQGFDCFLITFPAGERHKTATTWLELSDAIGEKSLGRDGAILALGGGVTGDLAGFVAATYRRGVPVVQLPTSLLAMIDASVGGKTGVDTRHGKNLLGVFHQPALVIADVTTLGTLDERDYRAGLAEAVKHAVISDATMLERLLNNADAIAARDERTLTEVVAHSVKVKASIVTVDPLERNARAVLNFGHTFGHAIEAASDYSLRHGEAVAIGMALEAMLAEQLGVCSAVSAPLTTTLEALGLPTELPQLDLEIVHRFLLQDKKNRDGTVRFALPRALGGMLGENVAEWTTAVDETTIKHFLDELS